jgi:hypothetical protein
VTGTSTRLLAPFSIPTSCNGPDKDFARSNCRYLGHYLEPVVRVSAVDVFLSIVQ